MTKDSYEDKKAFADGMTALGVVYATPINEVMLDTYWQFLCDLTREQFRMAVSTAGRKLKFFPKPAELRDCIGMGDAQVKLNASLAWEIVRKAMDKYDYVQTVDFGALANAVIRNMGDWRALCRRSLNELTWDRKQFEELYQQMASTEISAAKGAPLVGEYFKNVIRLQMPGETAAQLARPALPEKESRVLSIVRDLANAKDANARDEESKDEKGGKGGKGAA
jgi:hypothetical protein